MTEQAEYSPVDTSPAAAVPNTLSTLTPEEEKMHELIAKWNESVKQISNFLPSFYTSPIPTDFEVLSHYLLEAEDSFYDLFDIFEKRVDTCTEADSWKAYEKDNDCKVTVGRGKNKTTRKRPVNVETNASANGRKKKEVNDLIKKAKEADREAKAAFRAAEKLRKTAEKKAAAAEKEKEVEGVKPKRRKRATSAPAAKPSEVEPEAVPCC